jgi:hypothetical protein
MYLRFAGLAFALPCVIGFGCGEPFTAQAPGGDAGAATAIDGSASDGAVSTGDAALPLEDAGADATDGAIFFTPGKQVTLDLAITNDADDAVWINGTDERLSYSDGNRSIEVGADAEMGRVGLRFVVPIPRGATVDAATVTLTRIDGDALPTESMQLQVWEAASTPPFDGAHTHAPADHAPGGLWKTAVTGFLAGANKSKLESPDLKGLVQHVVDRTDWQAGGAIGLVISPDKMLSHWAGFADSADSNAGGDAAKLHLVFTPH